MTGLQKMFSPKDMTQGKPWQRMIEFAVPMLIGNFAQQLYNTADSIIVGKYVGDNALAAVGSASPIINMMLALFIGIATGAGIMVSQNFGAKNREGLSKTIGNCMTLTAIAVVIAMVFGLPIINPILRLLDTPESIIGWAATYLKILTLGTVGFFYYNILAGILRGMGDSLSALVFLLIAAGLNVVLDLWFVAGFKLGVAGVALATIIAQAISGFLCLLKLRKMSATFDMNADTLKPRKEYIGRIIRLGLPSGVTQAIMAVAIMLVQSLTNSFGEMVIACNVIVMRVDGFAMMPNMTFGMTLTTYTGQNIGARRLDRVKEGTKQGTLMALAFSTVITIMLLLFGKGLMRIFTTTDELVDLAYRMMSILAVGYVIMGFMMCISGVMRGCGNTMTPMWISLISSVAIRVPLAYVFAAMTKCAEWPNGKPQSTYLSGVISWVLGAVLTYIAFRFGKWRKTMYVEREPVADTEQPVVTE